jgi:DGQHR domain-containing protein
LDASEEQKALIFATINGKQTKVPVSLIYELFGVVEGRSPYKTAHEIARGLNADVSSPFYRRLKMLGKKAGDAETLSQGTFISKLLPHISNRPDEDFKLSRAGEPFVSRPASVFNAYFIERKDAVIYKILYNLFSAIKQIFPEEWNNPKEYILSKTTGYTAVMRCLPELYRAGADQRELTQVFFESVFTTLKLNLEESGQRLTSEFFSPGGVGERQLSEKITGSLHHSRGNMSASE